MANLPGASSPLAQPQPWNAVATGYAEDIVPHASLYAAEALKGVSLAPSSHVLDLAAGPGTATFLIAPLVARVSAVDFAPAMLEALRARADREHLSNIEAHVMDAQSLTFADATFDAAFCMFGVMFFPDRARAFRELHRVLRPGGRLVIATWGPLEARPMMKVCFDALAEVLPDLPAPQKGDLQDPESCMAELRAAGFRDVTARPFTAAIQARSAEDYLDVQERGGAPLVMLRKKLGEEGWKQARVRLLEVLGRSIPVGGTTLSAEALLSFGTR